MAIVTDLRPQVAPAYRPALLIVPVDTLGDRVAELTGRTLYINTSSAEEDQLWAIADAVRYLRTGQTDDGERVRHLSVVPTAAPIGA